MKYVKKSGHGVEWVKMYLETLFPDELQYQEEVLPALE
jgi:hypothetical protein